MSFSADRCEQKDTLKSEDFAINYIKQIHHHYIWHIKWDAISTASDFIYKAPFFNTHHHEQSGI